MRGERGSEPFDPTKVSPSRVNSFLSCGLAFKMDYIDRLPKQASGSAALFGTILHNGLEAWAPDRTQHLPSKIKEAWRDYTKEDHPVIYGFLKEYVGLSAEAMAKEQEIRDTWAARGKESKAPRMTKDFKESAIGRKLRDLQADWFPRLERDSFYRFSEYDPLPSLYDESLAIGERYEKRFHRLPAPLMTEFHLNERWNGFLIDAYIDIVEPVYDEDGELTALLILDYKSYRAAPPKMKDWRQTVMYDVGLRSLVERGAVDLPTHVPWYVGIDLLRWTESWKNEDGEPCPPRRLWRVTDADRDRLLKELSMYRIAVESGVFLPAEKGRKPDFCDYPENCCLRNCTAAGGGMEEVTL